MFCSPASLQFPTNDTINSLTNDCLVNIFDFLPLKEQLRSGQTCRRWWPLVPTIAGQTHLVVRRLPFGQSEELSSLGKPKSSQVESALKSILPAYGPRLISVSFDGCELSAAILDLTALLCPRLECLDLGLFAESLSNFSDLSKLVARQNCICTS